MTYNYRTERAPEPIDKVEEAVRLALMEVPAGKLVLGINARNETPGSIAPRLGWPNVAALRVFGGQLLRGGSFLEGRWATRLSTRH